MKIAVLGSSGAMGAYFTTYFLDRGHAVVGSDPRKVKLGPRFERTRSNKRAVHDADAVLVAVPPRETSRVVREVLPSMKPGSTIIEITSLKSGELSGLRRAVALRRVSLLSIHPLFGPNSRLKRPKICVIGGARELSAARTFFPRALFLPMSGREHDRLMAFTLSLVHLLNLSFISALADGIGISRFEGISTPLGSAQLRLAKAVLSQKPSLFSYIQAENPYVVEMLSSLIGGMKRLMDAAGGGDAAELQRLFLENSRRFRRGDLEEALRQVYLEAKS